MFDNVWPNQSHARLSGGDRRILLRQPSRGAPWVSRWRAIVEHVDIAKDHKTKATIVERLVRGGGVRTMGFVNAHALNSCVADERFAADLLDTDILVRDGIGVSALYRLAGWRAGLNLAGTDLLPEIFPQFAGRRIALFGTRAEVVERVATYMERALGSNIITADGFMPEQSYVDRVRAERPALVILGMGMPKQERVARMLKEQLNQNVAIVCGGAILDFLSGHVPRAPLWMRRIGMEWLFRLLREPTRLFHRYVIGNPLFLARSAIVAFSDAQEMQATGRQIYCHGGRR